MKIILKIEDVSIERSHQKIVSEFNLTIGINEVVGLIAPNGTGKTTLFKAIATLIKINHGRVSLNNIQANTDRLNYLRQFFFIESSENLYKNLTVAEHLNYVKDTWKSDQSVHEIINKLKMNEYSNKQVKHLSLGMKQHLLIGMYLVSDCPILILDEPLNGLDPSSVAIVIALIKSIQKEKIILISSHDLYNIEKICSRAIFMNEKKIVYDTTDLSNLPLLYKVIFEERGIIKNDKI